ncbi:MAG: (E)-4-hydroxy-3-methylbut-2-enyl-diphosphate synthase [Thermodesulfobacteriota bacterium]|nr:(E)-4-hydroxy-3-methylbut-2-enyl-diphosphate synthase [Thermodesulfobacteriota bacterium]
MLGNVRIGGDATVSVQSMTSTDTRDVGKTLAQIRRLEKAGCELVRIAVPDEAAAAAIPQIRAKIHIPLIADIHFHHRLAIMAIEAGVEGIRINPGNMDKKFIPEVVKAAREHGTVIRIGVNAGSLEKDLLEKHDGPDAGALVESALSHIRLLEDLDFDPIKVSLKSSDVTVMIRAYQLLSEKVDYPLHLGVTEAGSLMRATIKSSLGIGTLLYQGIGDTIRVSVTGDPVREIPVAYGILRALKIRMTGPEIISCPTCGRCEIDLLKLSRAVEKRLAGRKDYLKIALMGCVVNGPGEAAEADVGIAGGRGAGMLFRKGRIVRKVKEEDFVEALLAEIQDITKEKKEA